MSTFAARLVKEKQDTFSSWFKVVRLVVGLLQQCSSPFLLIDNLLFVLKCENVEVFTTSLFVNGPYFKYFAVFWRF